MTDDTAAKPAKCVCDSETEQVQVVMPQHLNGYGKLFGGQLAMWIDIVAGTVARRHCGTTITTAAIDHLRFLGPVCQNEMVVLKGRLTYVGTTSMEVRVDSYVEDNSGGQRLINTAFVIEVALDDEGNPAPVPSLVCRTDDQKKDCRAGEKRRAMRRKIQEELYD